MLRLSTKLPVVGFLTVLFMDILPTCTQVSPPPYIGWQEVEALAELARERDINPVINDIRINFFMFSTCSKIIKNDTMIKIVKQYQTSMSG